MNISLVKRVWWTEFKNEKAPDSNVNKNIIDSFEKTGSVVHITCNVLDPTQKRQEAKNKLETMVSDLVWTAPRISTFVRTKLIFI